MASTEAGARRGLLLVSSGFDLSPEDFYRAHRPAPKPIAAASEDPESVAEALARSLAAYGWITFPVVPTDDELQAGGLWLGQWRLGGPEGAVRETAVDPLHPEETVGQAMLNLLDLTRSGRRDPEKAEAYLELGATLAAEGDREEAEQALRLALHHLGEDPATADKQVEALLALADVLDSGGRRREARAILERARKLDAESAVAGRPLAELLDPIRPFERLAEATGGQVVRSREALLESLAGLPWRVRLTFQVSGAADGSLHPVEIRCLRRGCRARATAWIRSGTPREVAAARIRRWLADDQFEGDLAVEARLAPAGDAIELEVGIPPGGSMAAPPGGPGGSPAAPADLRVTLGEGDPESIGELRHQVEVPRLLSDPMRWGLSVALSRRIDPRPAGAVAVLVDHLESGRWGATLVERPEKLSDR
jgi:tetratricopeptide (TPR) repeat protein